MNIQKIPVEKLNPAAYNPRQDLQPGDPEYEKLKRSINEFGYVELIIWNKRTGNIVSGHQRYKVLRQQGLKEIDCVVVDLDDDREKALNVAMNKVGGSWDEALLAGLLKDLEDSDFDVTLTGFDMDEVEALFKAGIEQGEAIEDDFDADKALEDITDPITKRGDIWKLGRHRLMCGDATSAEEVGKLMGGVKASIIWTDPPWNVRYGQDSKHPSWKSRQILNDNMSTQQFHKFLYDSLTNIKENSSQGAMVYIAMSAQEWPTLDKATRDAGYHWSSTIIWVKDSLVLSRKDYHGRFEPLWYGWIDNGPRLCPLKDRKQSDVWEIDRPKRSLEHPTMKPLELVGRSLLNSSKKGDTVIDLFGGSGSTLIAAEQTGRTCHMMELDPKYVEVIIRRYQNLKGAGDDIFLVKEDGEIPLEAVG